MSVRTRFWLLAGIRWLSTGLVVPVAALLPLDRGLSIAEYGSAAAVQGIVVLLLELPTGGFADAVGRRPVWIASAVVSVLSYGLYSVAQTPAMFALAMALAGVYRALDSGPLNAWFVDAVHEEVPESDRGSVVARGLSGYASVVGVAIAAGALLSAGLVAWAPFGRSESLALPYRIACVLTLAQIVAAWVLMDDNRSARLGGVLVSIRATPRTILGGVALLLHSRVLRALIVVEVLWGFGMVAFESMTPIRLAELLDDRDLAAAIMGPATAAAWGGSALGAAAVPWMLRRWSPAAVSVALKLVQGATVVTMGVVGGAAGLVAGLLATYAVHSAAGAVYETLLHEQARAENRATVLSLASMAMHPGAAIGAVVLGAVATSVSPGAALVVGGIVVAAAAPLFLVREPRAGTLGAGPMLDRTAPAAGDAVHQEDLRD
jgi:DHA1 family tetracycline resistance protein-like MFS transporter